MLFTNPRKYMPTIPSEHKYAKVFFREAVRYISQENAQREYESLFFFYLSILLNSQKQAAFQKKRTDMQVSFQHLFA